MTLVPVHILLIHCRCSFLKSWSWGITRNICTKKLDKLGFCTIYYWLFFSDAQHDKETFPVFKRLDKTEFPFHSLMHVYVTHVLWSSCKNQITGVMAFIIFVAIQWAPTLSVHSLLYRAHFFLLYIIVFIHMVLPIFFKSLI